MPSTIVIRKFDSVQTNRLNLIHEIKFCGNETIHKQQQQNDNSGKNCIKHCVPVLHVCARYAQSGMFTEFEIAQKYSDVLNCGYNFLLIARIQNDLPLNYSHRMLNIHTKLVFNGKYRVHTLHNLIVSKLN